MPGKEREQKGPRKTTPEQKERLTSSQRKKPAKTEKLSYSEQTSRIPPLEERELQKKEVISLYKKRERTLKSEDFEEDIRQVLQKSHPDYLKVLKKRRRDMQRSDHAIVIAGETSAGKSTLINKILGKRIFKGDTLESTATICKLRNSEKIQITVEHTSGETEVKDLTESCDTETKEGLKILRDTLNELTNMTSSKKSKQYRSVDIEFPIPFLSVGDTILVDTPGIGGSGEVTQKLMEYLPNAVSFVFVINVGSAGGMQNDRLPEILRSLNHLRIDNEMPCFDPNNVIFVTNKWDTISSCDSDSDEDDQAEKTWKSLQSTIKEKWPTAKDEHIFKMSLKEVAPEKKNQSTEQFKEFQKALKFNIEKAENIRITEHLRFLQEILKNITKGLRARLDLNKMNEKEQADLAKAQQVKIAALTQEINEVNETLQKRIIDAIQETAQSYYNYMSTDDAKELILNPIGREPILEVSWHPSDFSEEIKSRLCAHVEGFLTSRDVTEKFTEIKEDLITFYQKVCKDIYGMENDWIDETNENAYNVDDVGEISTGAFVGVVVATSPIWIPLLAAGIGLIIGFAGVALALSPFLVPLQLVLGRKERKKKIIDEEYETFRTDIVRSFIRNHLQENVGTVLEKLIRKVTLTLRRRIEALEEMTQQMLKSRKEILAKRNKLQNNEREIQLMAKTADRLHKKINIS